MVLEVCDVFGDWDLIFREVLGVFEQFLIIEEIFGYHQESLVSVFLSVTVKKYSGFLVG